MDIFSYGFMRTAFAAAVCIALIAPCIGVVLVLKRLSGIGEATSHSALGGIAFGLVVGINPVLGAVVFSLLAALSIEVFRKHFDKYSEISTAVVMSAGIGITALLSGFIRSGNGTLNSFMFGSIVAVSDAQLCITVVLTIFVAAIMYLLYKELFYITFDEDMAKIAGIPVGKINFLFTIITALTVAIASRIVGALMISSLMVIPVACAMVVAKSYKQTVSYSIAFSQAFTLGGLVLSYYFDLRPGGTIVTIGVIALIFIMLVFDKERR